MRSIAEYDHQLFEHLSQFFQIERVLIIMLEYHYCEPILLNVKVY